MSPKISIIVPCYNQAQYLDEALQSVLNQTYTHWECIIVNDGSPDNTDDVAKKWVEKDKRFKYYFKENGGLSSARNYGINRANGEYILPLDADNQLINDFIQDAIAVFDKNQDIGVVHGNAEFFGLKNGLWKIDQYDPKKILAGNYIDACAIFRKKFWLDVGGYDEKMLKGHEDWEFWVAMGVLNVKFHHLNKITFRYFVSEKSMVRALSNRIQQSNYEYILKKHNEQCQRYYAEVYSMFKKNEIEYNNNLKSEKFVIDVFCSTFFNFSVFGLYKKNKS